MGKKGSKSDPVQLRSNYIDHSLRFLDWVNGLGFEKTRLGQAVHRIDQSIRLRRIGILFVYSLILSVLLFYDFDFSFSVRVGERTTRDIKSPLNFDVVDEVASEEKRRQAENAIAMVFDFDRALFEDTYSRVYSSFRRMRTEMRSVTLSHDEFVRFDQIKKLFGLKELFEKQIGHTISDPVFEWLIDHHFSPRIENMLLQTLDGWSTFKIADGVDKLVAAGQTEILAREVSRGGHGREVLVPIHDLHEIGHDDQFPINHTLAPKEFTSIDHRLLEDLARSLISANVTFNRQESETRRQKARDAVLPVVIAIKKNQVIVPEGSVVQPLQATILNEIENQRSGRNRNVVALVASIMFVVMFLVFLSYLRRFTLNRVRITSKETVIMGVVLLFTVAVTKFFLFLTNTAFSSAFGTLIPESAFLFAAPVATGTMLVGLLIYSGEVVWIFSLFLSVAVGLMVDLKFSLMLVSVVSGLAAARGVFGCKKRNDLYLAGFRTGLINATMVMLVVTVQHLGDESYMHQLVWDVPAGFLSGLLSSLLALMTVPLLETIFNCTTDVKLLELSNLNHPLLKEMIVKAPGTYHHSLVVGSMVEAAAEEIGANPLLAKVMSYYHDIGKIGHAQYFIENQKSGQNPHDHLSPHMSRTILVAHVKDGVEMGLEHKLGKAIIDGIVQHHGTTLIAYFYNRALEQQDQDIDEVREDDFRYPGPKPQFREAALIMLADSIEAASRSLDEPTPSRLQNIVRTITQRKFMDGQLDECNLTLKDLSIIESSFIRVLNGIYHTRIDYPKGPAAPAVRGRPSQVTVAGGAAASAVQSVTPPVPSPPVALSNETVPPSVMPASNVIAGPGAKK